MRFADDPVEDFNDLDAFEAWLDGPPAMMTVHQAAKQLGVSPDEVRRLIRSDELFAWEILFEDKRRPVLRVAPDDLATYLRKRRRVRTEYEVPWRSNPRDS